MGARKVVYPAAAVLFGLLLSLSILEVVFRVLPTSDTLIVQPVNSQQPIFRYLGDRTVYLSKGPLFSIRAEKRVNKHGFLSDTEYREDSTQPRIAVVGDSYVAATQVANSASIAGSLGRLLQGHLEVYAFGSSGSPLSQYLAYARYAQRQFSPSLFVFVIIANDFDESVLEYARSPGFHYFGLGERGCDLVRLDFSPSRARELLRQSAFLRYLYVNVGIEALTLRSFLAKRDGGDYISNVPTRVSQERLAKSKRAVICFLEALKRDLGETPAVFVLDAPRPLIYSTVKGDVETARHYDTTFPGQMYPFFAAHGRQLGFEIVDLTPVFTSHFRLHNKRFEFPNDNHWNELGHAVAAETLLRSDSIRRLVKATRLQR